MKAVPSAVTDELLRTLRDLLGDRVSTAPAIRDHHSHGESYHAPALPDLVAFPRTTEEISAIVRAAAARRVPIVPFGAGTSLEGQVLALEGGLSIDLTQMNQVLRVSVDDLDATVQAGVTHRQLNRHLANTGLTFFMDPGADATLGGMTATGASGTTAVRYGTMRENVRGLTVVLADGKVITTGGRARKSSAGYDLTRLFVGSEGTLGVISEVTVRLQPLPEAVAVAVCSFPTIDSAVKTVIATIQLGVPVARIELLDEIMMNAINQFSKLDYPAQPALFFEFHGTSEREVCDQAETVQTLAGENDGAGFAWVTRLEDRERLWKARHDSVLRVARVEARRESVDDRCLRADFPARRLHRRIEARPGRLAVDRDACRARRRRQFPHAVSRGSGPSRGDGRSAALERPPGSPGD